MFCSHVNLLLRESLREAEKKDQQKKTNLYLEKREYNLLRWQHINQT